MSDVGCAAALPSNDISSGRTINYMRLSVNEMQTNRSQLVTEEESHASRGRGTLVPASLFLHSLNNIFSVGWVMWRRIFAHRTLGTLRERTVVP